MRMAFDPYKNESDSLQIGGLTIENRRDRISIYGSSDITLDKDGLEIAEQLQSILTPILAHLKTADLPDQVQLIPAETVKNPFI